MATYIIPTDATIRFNPLKAPSSDRRTETCAFKSTPSGELNVDFFPTRSGALGTMAFLHGGALLLGSRADLPATIVEFLNSNGWNVASLDYRSAPETSIA